MNTNEKLYQFFFIFGNTTAVTDKRMEKDLNITDKKYFDRLYKKLKAYYEDIKTLDKSDFNLINLIWKKYSNDYKNFGIDDDDARNIRRFNNLKKITSCH